MTHETLISRAIPVRAIGIALLAAVALAGCGDDSNSPSHPTYTVGGNVTGLTAGKSLVLHNNGQDDKTITTDGAFTFATALRDGAAYVVTVFPQPVGMACPVIGGTGTIAAADVTAVAVDCVAVTTALDPTFGPGGVGFATFDAGSSGTDSGNEMTFDGSGLTLVAGHSFNAATGALEMGLWRVNTNGTAFFGSPPAAWAAARNSER